METFFTADTHFNHKNIITHCERPFDSVEEMNETMIELWNKRVGKHDHIYHLGDFGWLGCEEIFNRLNGHKYLIKGNHDDKYICKYGWAWVKEGYSLKLKPSGLKIWLSHYSHRVWRSSFHGRWHLFGHTHGQLGPYGLSFDVGVDCWDFSPLHLNEITLIMQKLEEKLGNNITL